MSDWEPMKHPTVEIEGQKHTRPIEVRASCVTCGRCGQTVREDTARPQHPGLHLSRGQTCRWQMPNDAANDARRPEASNAGGLPQLGEQHRQGHRGHHQSDFVEVAGIAPCQQPGSNRALSQTHGQGHGATHGLFGLAFLAVAVLKFRSAPTN